MIEEQKLFVKMSNMLCKCRVSIYVLCGEKGEVGVVSESGRGHSFISPSSSSSSIPRTYSTLLHLYREEVIIAQFWVS